MIKNNIFTDYIASEMFVEEVLGKIFHDLKETFPNLTPDECHDKMLEYIDENLNEWVIDNYVADEFEMGDE